MSDPTETPKRYPDESKPVVIKGVPVGEQAERLVRVRREIIRAEEMTRLEQIEAEARKKADAILSEAQRQADDVEVAALDPAHQHGTSPLNTVCAGLVHGLAAGDVAGDLCLGQVSEGHLGNLGVFSQDVHLVFGAHGDDDGGDDLVLLSR